MDRYKADDTAPLASDESWICINPSHQKTEGRSKTINGINMTKGTSEGTGVQGRSGRGLATRIPDHRFEQRANFLHNRIND